MENEKLNRWLERLSDLYLQGILSAEELDKISRQAVFHACTVESCKEDDNGYNL